jgi:hypothetical protein
VLRVQRGLKVPKVTQVPKVLFKELRELLVSKVHKVLRELRVLPQELKVP